jgi:nucleotide-binding universal stress UspA family protein
MRPDNTCSRDMQFLGIGIAKRVGQRGDVAAQVLEVAADSSADLIVMTTHGRTGLGRLLFGSVAERILHGATVPVLVLRTPRSALTTEMATSG